MAQADDVCKTEVQGAAEASHRLHLDILSPLLLQPGGKGWKHLPSMAAQENYKIKNCINAYLSCFQLITKLVVSFFFIVHCHLLATGASTPATRRLHAGGC